MRSRNERTLAESSTPPVIVMTKSFQLLSLAIFLAGGLPSDGQEASLLIDGPSDLPSITGEKGPRIATAEQEAEIRRFVEDLVITDQENESLRRRRRAGSEVPGGSGESLERSSKRFSSSPG